MAPSDYFIKGMEEIFVTCPTLVGRLQMNQLIASEVAMYLCMERVLLRPGKMHSASHTPEE